MTQENTTPPQEDGPGTFDLDTSTYRETYRGKDVHLVEGSGYWIVTGPRPQDRNGPHETILLARWEIDARSRDWDRRNAEYRDPDPGTGRDRRSKLSG